MDPDPEDPDLLGEVTLEQGCRRFSCPPRTARSPTTWDAPLTVAEHQAPLGSGRASHYALPSLGGVGLSRPLGGFCFLRNPEWKYRDSLTTAVVWASLDPCGLSADLARTLHVWNWP